MPKAIVAAIAALVTIGLTLVYASFEEQKFFVYVPYVIRGLADTPTPFPLEDRVAALETQVAQLAKLLTPTPTPSPTPSPTPTATPAVLALAATELPRYTQPVGYTSTFTASVTGVSPYDRLPDWNVVTITATFAYNGDPLAARTVYTAYYYHSELIPPYDKYALTRATRNLGVTDSSGTVSFSVGVDAMELGRIIAIILQIEVPTSIAASGYIQEVRYIELR